MFYGLPKVHKCNQIKSAIVNQKLEYILCENPADLKFRPIVAGTACPTSRLSHVLDIVLKPFLKYVDSYVRDTVHFLNKLPSKLNTNEIFATFDVVSLYSNIPHDLGRKALNFWLDLYNNDLGKFSKTFVIEGATLILNNNYFEFNSENYLQKTGTAMGTKFAPVYANLVLGFLEISLKEKIREKFGTEKANTIMKNYFRFLDDIFVIWDINDGNVNILHEILASLDSNLSFTLDQSGSSVNFLDVKVSKVDTRITTDIFYKETDTHQYLDFKSSHPNHTKRNIPYNLARRICTIVSEPEILQIRLTELTTFLVECNYPKSLIENGIRQARMIPQNKLRTTTNIRNNVTEKIPFISTYNPNSQNLFPTVSSVLDSLKADPSTEAIFTNAKIVNSKRQPNNLKSLLTSARLKLRETSFKVSKCNDKRCDLCNFILEGSTFDFKEDNYKLNVNSNMNYNVLKCIYVLKCKGCQEIYIGETSNFRLRANLHKSHINKNCGLRVSRHIYACARDKVIKFQIMPFYKVRGDDTRLRKEKENYFITKFKPSLNSDNCNQEMPAN